MKNLTILLSIAITLFSCNGNGQNQLKRYNVKSGIVKYTTTISGKMMGSKIAGGGTESLYFKNWGALELKESASKQTTTMKFFGKEKIESTSNHSMNKLDNGESYSVDFDAKTITAGRDSMMDLMIQTNSDTGEAGKSMLESLGGKKIGEETYQGYNCEIWEILNGKQWIYKGVMLKMEITVLGIKTLTEASNAKFDVAVPESNFNLPDFPIKKTESYMNNDEYEDDLEDINNELDKISKLSFEEWQKMVTKDDPEMQNMSDEELHQTYDMIQKMVKMKKGN